MADLQVRAVSKYIMGSPIKMRRVVNSVRGMRAPDALEVLKGEEMPIKIDKNINILIIFRYKYKIR